MDPVCVGDTEILSTSLVCLIADAVFFFFFPLQVCQELNNTWAWELEQKGYQEMSMECKSSILKVPYA